MRKLHWRTLGVVLVVPFVLVAGHCLFRGGTSAFLLAPLFLIGGAPYFLVMGIRSLFDLNPYGLHGSVLWTLVVGVLYLINLTLLVGIVVIQDVWRRMVCVAAVVLFWIAALWGISVWAGQSC